MSRESLKKNTICITIEAPIKLVWECLTTPRHVIRWSNFYKEWHTPELEFDLSSGGRFLLKMKSMDEKHDIIVSGKYDQVEYLKKISFTFDEGEKKATITLSEEENQTTKLTKEFEVNEKDPPEGRQYPSWPNILIHFKRYTENYAKLENLNFEIIIDAPKELVYKKMLDEKYFRQWSAEFHPSTYYQGSWEKNSKILFMANDQDGRLAGMISRIKENIPYEYVCIEHIGIIENGKEVTTGPKIIDWIGAKDKYFFKTFENRTHLSTSVDSSQDFKAFLSTAWPKALKKIKSICEAKVEDIA